MRDALERLGGPIVDRAAVREQERAHWELLVSVCQHIQLREGFANQRISAWSNASAGAYRGIPRSLVAATLLGDAHALNGGRAEGELLLPDLGSGP